MNQLPVSTFFNTDFREFADYDNKRKIPHIADGLKPSNRKVLFTIEEHDKLHKVSALGNLSSSFCFTGETPVILADGSQKRIDEMEVGDQVINYNEVEGAFRRDEVVAFIERGERDIVEVEMEDGTVFRCTPDHKFLTNNGWKEIRHIGDDDLILSK